MSDILRWMLAIEALGLAVLPVVWAALSAQPVPSVACAKPFGIVLVGAAAWLGPTLGIYPYTDTLVFAAVAAVALIAWAGWGRGFIHSIRRLSRREVVLLCLPEIVFVAAATWQAFMVSLNPSVYLVEPMNFAFVNAINRSQWLPPNDPWLAGYTLNYYYFGHFLIAALIRLAGTPLAIGFSLAGITLFASVVTLIFGIVFDTIALQAHGARPLAAPALAGLAAVFMALFNGNLVPLSRFITTPSILGSWLAHGDSDWWRLPYHAHGALSELPWRTYLLHYTHSFDNALPFLLLMVVWGLHYWSASRRAAHARRPRIALYVLLTIGWGSVGLISPWVLPAAGLMLVALMLRDALPIVLANSSPRRAVAWQLFIVLAPWVAVLAASVLLVRMIAQQYQIVGQQELVRIDMTNAATAISPRTLILQFGIQLTGIGLVALGYARRLRLRMALWAGPVALALGGLIALSRLGVAASIFFLLWWVLLLIAIAHARQFGDVPFSLLLLFVAVSLNTLPFFIVLHDAGNTFFKFGFLAWIISSIGLFAEFGTLWVSSMQRASWARRALAVGVAVVLFVGAWMPAIAAFTTTNRLQGWGIQTLDGVYFYLQRTHPGEYEAVRWLNGHAATTAVVLEATAQAYTPAGRIAAFTGLPTLVGWFDEQAEWREHDPTAVSDIRQRVADVQRIYQTPDSTEAQCLVQKYDVTYVVVGGFERQRFLDAMGAEQRAAALAKFEQFMDVAYPPSGDHRKSDIVIYQRRVGSDIACRGSPNEANR